jgi:hypothetical protein
LLTLKFTLRTKTEFSFKFTDMIAHMIEKKWGERKKINKSSGVGRPHAE